MSPFVQELISFISIMLGVVILTAWVMWILLRPSGASKAKDFARESARNGLTRAVMENNELRNTVSRLERENKVLMSAGYGKKSASQAGEAEEKAEEERVVPKEERGKVEGERVEAKGEELKIKGEVEKPAASAQPKIVEETSKEAPKTVDKTFETISRETAVPSDETKVKPEDAGKDVSSSPPITPDQKPDADEKPASNSEPHRIIDEAEKKKIADYLANVEKTTERQKKEIEAIDEGKEAAPTANDNLKKIRGVGLHLENRLKNAGITSYQQIAEFDGRLPIPV